ncbi:hypothetical protein [Kordia sp.]|uniref:hypothetical protein n=1 Tax=Kordia sp. TaxID=1965332 RepID=UPI003D6A0EE3
MTVFKKVMAILFVCAFASCSSDDDTNTNDVQSIIGDWEVISLVSDGVEFIEPNDTCFDKYFITAENARYLEYFPLNGECIAAENDIISYPILPYTYEGSTFVFDDATFQIIELTQNTIKWSQTYEEEGETITDTETLRRIQ